MVLLMLFALCAGAADVTINSVLDQMQKSEKSITAVRFSYDQEISYTLTSEKQSNTGEVTFQKPNNLSIQQIKPLEQLIVSNGKKVWVYTPAYNQVIVDNWKRWMKSSMVPASLLHLGQNWAEMKKEYSFSYAGFEGTSSSGTHVIVLEPRKQSPMGKWKLRLWVDTKEFIPRKAVLLGENITVTTVTKDYVVNPQLEKKAFTFKPPPQAEVLTLP